MSPFMPLRNLLFLVLTLASINAQNTNSYQTVSQRGPYNFSDHESNITASLYEQAAASPNTTRSIKFHPFAWFSGLNPQKYRDIEWTWRVNVSDFLATSADPESVGGAPQIDPHVVLNTYDFSWAGRGNLSEQVGRDSPVCITTLTSYTWPANVTNRYAEGDADSADCGPVLGDACRDAIISAGASDASRCGSPRKPWSALSECAGSLGYAHDQSRFAGLVTFDFNASNSTRPRSAANATRVPGSALNPTSGTGFYAFNSGPRNATNATDYYEAANRLHVVMINAQLPIPNGKLSRPTLVCMRVNTTKIEEDKSSAVRAAGLNTPFTGLVGVMILLALLL